MSRSLDSHTTTTRTFISGQGCGLALQHRGLEQGRQAIALDVEVEALDDQRTRSLCEPDAELRLLAEPNDRAGELLHGSHREPFTVVEPFNNDVESNRLATFFEAAMLKDETASSLGDERSSRDRVGIVSK